MKTAEEIHEKYEMNTLIAMFMGGSVLSEEEHELPHGSRGYVMIRNWSLPKGVPLRDIDGAKIGRFNYNLSWDWLRPVMDKCWDLTTEDEREFCSLNLFELGLFADFESVYESVIEFVKWYNEKL